MSSSRTAIVTGAAQGIGKAIALRLADDGFDVAVNDIQSKRDQLDSLKNEIIAKGRRCVAIEADISLEDQVKAMVEDVVSEMGRLDVVYCDSLFLY
jgi:NAD(P)-dependent dehydrogenase (short-subunit alcohol dehydrogenase family)